MERQSLETGPLRMALVGAGNIAKKHLNAFRERPEVLSLAAVCDPNGENAAQIASSEGGTAKIFSTVEEMLSSGDIDGVIISTPHFLHFPQALACLNANVPVLVEKPLVNTLDELRALREAAGDTIVMAGQMRRFERDSVWAKQWMTDERFGPLQSFDIQSWQNINAYINQVGRNHWLLDGEKAGGGVVISLAIHQLDLVRFLTGQDFEEVTAIGRFDPPFFNGAESSASVLLKMSNGASGTLHATYNAERVPFCEAMTLFGANGTLTQMAERVGDYRGVIRVATGATEDVKVFPDQWKGFEQANPEALREMNEDSFVNQLVHFAEAVRGARPVQNSIDENWNTIAVVEAIKQSLVSGETVKVAKP